MIRVFLADDQSLVRSGISAVLEAAGDIIICGEAGDGEAALAAILADPPDVAVLDIRMPKRDGIGVVQALRAADDATPVILLTTFDDDRTMIAGIRAGAAGFLLKDIEVGPLVAAIRRVAAGEDCLAGLPPERLVAALRLRDDDGEPDVPDPLTRRERHVLALMSAGLSNQEIADALHVALGTIKNHVSTILSKLQTSDRTKAVLKALRDGLI